MNCCRQHWRQTCVHQVANGWDVDVAVRVRGTRMLRSHLCWCRSPAAPLKHSNSAAVPQIAGSTEELLSPEVRQGLVRLGSVQLRCCPPGEPTAVYSLPRYGGLQLTRPAPAAEA